MAPAQWCPKCKAEVSNGADACPKCAHPIKKRVKPGVLLQQFGNAFIILGLIMVLVAFDAGEYRLTWNWMWAIGLLVAGAATHMFGWLLRR